MTEKKATTQSSLGELIERFANMSPEERQRDIAKANEYLRANGVKNLSDFDKLMRSS